jgi:hypothetical protein
MENFFISTPTWCVVLLASIVAVITICDLVLRAFALWKSARRNQVAWFVCLVIFNTACILPIIYLIINRKRIRE